MIQWYLTEDIHQAVRGQGVYWITGGELTIFGGREVPLDIAASFQVDPLSAVMVGFVTFVGFPDPPLLGGLHARRAGPRLLPLLLLPEPLHVRHADPGPRLQPAGALRRLGGRRAVLLPADRLLLREGLVRVGRQEGLHRQPHRRLRLPAGDLLRLLHASGPSSSTGLCRGHGDRPPPTSSRAAATIIGLLLFVGAMRQVGPDSALRLAARRHGRPDPGLGPDPRRHHGHGRRLHGRPLQLLLPARAPPPCWWWRSSAA